MLIRWKNKDKSSSSSGSSNTQTLPASSKSSSKKKRKFGKGEDWEKGRDEKSSSENSGSRGDEEIRRSRNRRDDPRRHTLSGDQSQFASQQMLRSAEFESTLPRGYPLHNSAMLFDDDPGIMSEVETSSTGFRRGGKQRSSLPVVRTPSKTLERPLGLVFLQYRSETKRALLPNEITSIDTVKALFVRSFSKQLTMEYLDSPNVKIYIHDSSKDMFYELEDLRSHLRDIRDRSVLRLFEATDVSGGTLGATLSIQQPTWDQDQSYFSEPEFDSEFQHQHIHKTKGSKISAGAHSPYYMANTASLPRGATLPRNYTMPKVAPAQYDDSYYQYPSRTGSITPVIDEETSDSELMDDTYSLSYGIKIAGPGPTRPYSTPVIPPHDTTRIRVEHMERQLANLTGLVQKALTHSPSPSPREIISMGLPPSYRAVSTEDMDKHSGSSTASLPDNKSVSFEKSVSFSEDPPTNSPKQHSPQHTVDSKPSKPAIKSSTLPRTSSQDRERDRHKPVHLKPLVSQGSTGQYEPPQHNLYRADLQLTPEMYNQLRGLQKKAKDLRQDMRNLRRMSQAQAHSTRESIKDTFIKIRAILVSGNDGFRLFSGDADCLRINREEDLYKQEMLRLESDLTDLESTVEELRGNVINRKTRVNMSDVENMALVLSKSSKTVADLKLRFPGLQNSIKTLLGREMEKVLSEETFIKDEPERLETALRRCKKLTGTLVTLKRLASVQEQRLPDARMSPTTDEPPPVTPNKFGWRWSSYFKEAITSQEPPSREASLSERVRPMRSQEAEAPPPVRRMHSTFC
uniref:Coiled-coil domain-containing protein CG32809 n=1 Tax=Cacopsylla melanoneura TaxID=428564 RepID=A0A8D8LX71_9HEMI